MRKLLLLMVILSLLLVACDTNKEVEVKTAEPEVVVVEVDDLTDLEAVKAFFDAQASGEYLLDENFTSEYFDVTGNGTEELLIRNESGGIVPVITLTEEGKYAFLESALMAKTTDVITVEGAFILVDNVNDAGFNKKSVRKLYVISESNIVALLEGELLMSKTNMMDRILNTSTVITTTIVNEDEWSIFTVDTKEVYVDEFGTSHDFKNTIRTYRMTPEATGYYVSSEETSSFSALEFLISSIKIYGEDESLMTFEEVYAEKTLEETIQYYSENRLNFIKGAKEDFADAIMDKLKKINVFFVSNDFDQFENIDVTDEAGLLSILFKRNNGTVIEKDQSIFAYYKLYDVTPEGVLEFGYKVAFKNEDLSYQIYRTMIDAKKTYNKTRIGGMMVHAVGLEGYLTSPVSVPNVLVVDTKGIEYFEGEKKSTLMVPMTLLNGPIEMINIKSLKNGNQLGGMKITYIGLKEDRFNINYKGNHDVEGTLSYDKREQRFVIDIDQEAIGFLYYDYPNFQLRDNVLTGKQGILNEEDMEKFLGLEVINKVKAGEEVEVAGTVGLALISGFEMSDEGYSSVSMKDLFVK